MATDRDSNSSKRLISEVPSSPPPLITQNQANPRRSCLGFIYKAVFVSIILIILPLFPSTAPEFVNQTINDRSWELVHLLFVGIVVSYGLFSHRNVETEKEIHFKNDNTQTYMSRILQVSSVFDDDNQFETLSGSDANLVQTWSSEYYRGESNVLVAGQNSEERNFSLHNVSVKPLVLPVRSLRSQISDPDIVESSREEELFGSSGFFSSSVSCSNVDRNVNGENGDLGFVHLDEKFKGNFVLPSPVPWRSRSGKMIMMNEQVKSFVPSVEESEFNQFDSDSFPMSNYLSSQPISTFPLKTTSVSQEFQFKSVNDTTPFRPNSTFPPSLETPSVSSEFRYENVNETLSFQPNSTFPPLKTPSVSGEFQYEHVNQAISFPPNSTFPPLKIPSVSPEFQFENVSQTVSSEHASTFPNLKKLSCSPEFRHEDANGKEKKKKKKKISKSSSPPTRALSPTTSPTRNGFSVNKESERQLRDQKEFNRSSGEDSGLRVSNSEAKSRSITSNSEGFDQEKGIHKRSFKDQKDLTRRSREDSELHFSNSEATHKSKTRIERSSKGKSVRTVRKSELVEVNMKNGDNLDEKTGKKSKGVEEVLMEKTRKKEGSFSSLSHNNEKRSHETAQPLPNFSKYQKKHKKKLAEKVILETEEYSDSEVDEIRGTLDSEKAKNDAMSDAKSDSNEVDKKADEFIAKFREQIRLQKIETAKRSSHAKHSRNSSR